MARPALARIGIGAALAIGLSSCGAVESDEGPRVVETGGGQDTAAAATSPAPGDDSIADGIAGEGDDDDGVVTPDTAAPASTTPGTTTDTAAPASTADSSAPVSSTTGADGGTTTQQTGAPDISPPAPTPVTEPALAPTPPSAAAQASPSFPKGGPVDGIGLSQGAAFTTYTERAMAITYDPQLVPEGSTINLVRQHGTNSTSISVAVAGLLPDHEYAAHVHMDTCGKEGDDAGPSYRNNPSLDPVPKAVNRENEIWLELETGNRGTAQSSATVDWPIRPGEGYSLIIHAEEINTIDTEVNELSERAACFVLARV